MSGLHKYDSNSNIYNFFFHPLHRQKEHSTKSILAVVTNIFMTVVSGGLWQIPFWIVNRLDHKKVKVLDASEKTGVSNASVRTGVFSSGTPTQKAAEEKVSEGGGDTTVEGVTDTGPPFDVSQIAFGKDQWEKHFGVDVGVEPPLPPDINNILTDNCKLFPGKKVFQTHVLVLVPETVNNERLTLENLGKLVKTPLNGSNASEYDFLSPTLSRKEQRDEPSHSHWVLLTKEVIGGEEIGGFVSSKGTRNVGFYDQKQMLEDIFKKEKIPYEVPSARDTAICLFMHNVSTGNRLFGEGTYTTCREKGEFGYPISVGFKSSGKLIVQECAFDGSKEIGMAAARLFS